MQSIAIDENQSTTLCFNVLDVNLEPLEIKSLFLIFYSLTPYLPRTSYLVKNEKFDHFIVLDPEEGI